MLAVTLLLAVHFALAVGSKLHESTTSDELAHLVGGLSYWDLNDYRFQPENGNLPQRWAAIPAWLMGTKLPPLKNNFGWAASDVWAFGHQVFYETGDDHFTRLMAGRAMIALFSVGIGLMIFLWSRRLFGTAGGFVSLIFFVFCPSFLAQGALVTSDACMAFFMLATVGLWWRHLHRPTTGALVASAVVFGLSCVSKFSAALLIPMMIILALIRLTDPAPLVLFGRARAGVGSRLGAITLSLLVHGAVAVFTIWAFFGFRYSGFNPKLPPPVNNYIQSFTEIQGYIGAQGPLVHAMSVWHLLPEAFLYGYTFVIEMSQQRAEFLDGMHAIHGWRSFFILAFLYKATVPFLAACLLTAGVAFTRWKQGVPGLWRRDLYILSPLLVLFGVYWAVSIPSHLNIGERHILPTYPVLLIGLGALAQVLFARRRIAALAVALLLVWQAGEAIVAAPHFIAYFNEPSGGPDNGYRHLADSSLDWGQDLPGLAQWLAHHRQPDEKVYLSYFGSGDPLYYGITAERLPFINGFGLPDPYEPLGPGLYCIGATMLDQVYVESSGPWTIALERDYQQLRTMAPLLFTHATDEAGRKKLDQELPRPVREHARHRFLALRFARLCFYLRVCRPEAIVGHSIFIYRLTDEELHAAVNGSLKEWSDQITRTASQ